MNKRILVRCAALVLLAVTAAAVNLPGNPLYGGSRKTAATGSSVGEILPDFSVSCLDGSIFTLSEQRGETVVVNLWATWCAPCVKELPHFDRLLREHGDDTAVLAVHCDPVTEDVEAWLAGYDYGFPVALAGGRALADLLGGGDVLPRTVVISPDGTVLYNAAGSVDYETLLRLTGHGE